MSANFPRREQYEAQKPLDCENKLLAVRQKLIMNWPAPGRSKTSLFGG